MKKIKKNSQINRNGRMSILAALSFFVISLSLFLGYIIKQKIDFTADEITGVTVSGLNEDSSLLEKNNSNTNNNNNDSNIDNKTDSQSVISNGAGYILANLVSSDGSLIITDETGKINLNTSLGTSIDMSSETNLRGGSGIVLKGNTLSIAQAIARDSELHEALDLSGEADYITLDGQTIVRNLIDLNSHVTGILPVASGGTGVSDGSPIFNNLTLNGNQILNGTLSIRETGLTPNFSTTFFGADQNENIIYTLPASAPENNGYVLTAQTDGTMSWSLVSGTSGVSGIGAVGQVVYWSGANTITGENYLSVSRGGTGLNASAVTDGQILIGNSTANDFSLASISQGNGIIVTNGTGTITIASTLGTTIDISSETNLVGDGEIILTGDSLSIAASIARDSELHNAVTLAGQSYLSIVGQVISAGIVELGTHTSGNYVAGLTPGTAITISGTAAEGWSPTVGVSNDSIGDTQLTFNTGQDLTNVSTPTFGGLTLNGNQTITGTLGIKETGTTPTYFTTFQGGDQSANITYTLPTSNTNGLMRNTAGVLTWDTNTYLTGNQTITLSGDVTGTGTTSIVAAVVNDSHDHSATTLPNTISYLGSQIDISDETNLAVSGVLLVKTDDTLSIKEGALTSGRLCTYDTLNGLVCNTESSTVGHSAVTINAIANGLSVDASQILTLGLSSSTTTGALSSTDWTTFNNKQNALTLGDITGTANQVSIIGGVGAIIGTGVSLSLPQDIATTSAPTFGGLTLNGNQTITGTLGIKETGDTPTYFTTFQGGDQSANITYTLPTSQAAGANYVLANDGNGALSWQLASTGTMTNPMTTLGDIIYGGDAGAPTRLAGAAGFLTSTGSAAPAWTSFATDSFTQYALLAGRIGGQTLIGGIGITDILKLQGTSGNGTLTSPAIQALVGSNGATNALTILNNGNVGIGTASPNYPLHVYRSGIAKYIAVGNVASPNTTAGAGGIVVDVAGGGGIYMSDSTAGVYGKYEVYDGLLGIGTMSNNSVAFSANNTEVMRISATGNVGIGTTTPGTKLDVSGAVRISGDIGIGMQNDGVSSRLQLLAAPNRDAAYFYVQTSGTGFFTKAYTSAVTSMNSGFVDSNNYMIAGLNVVNIDHTNHTSDLSFVTRTGGTLSSKLTVLSNGNVGIGTTSPTAILNIKAGTATAGTAPLKFTAGTNLTTTEAGAMEFDGTHLYFTATNGGTRYQLDQQSGGLSNPMTTLGDIIYGGASGTPTRLAGAAGFLTSSGSSAPAWTSFATDSFTQYALLAGRIGGQTLIGGTEANNILTLQGNSATTGNTLTNIGMQFNVGNSGLNNAITILNNGNIGINDISPDHILDIAGNLGLDAGSYINFGDTDGATGYGFRDNGGVMEFKNSTGDWTAFVTGGGSSTFLGLTDTPSTYTAGSILFTSGSAVTQDNANLFWDDVNNKLGIGTNTPVGSLQVYGGNFIMNGMIASDGIDDYTKLMLHTNGTDGSAVFADSETIPKVVTVSGNAQIDTARNKFGGAAGLFDGSGDYLTIPYSSDFDPGSSDFTYDFWMYPTNYSSSTVTMLGGTYSYGNEGGTQNAGWEIQALQTTGNLAFGWGNGGSWIPVLTTTTAASLNSWSHVALVKNGSTYTIYLNGNNIGSTTYATSIVYAKSYFHIGAHGVNGVMQSFYSGWLDEIRISKGIARWTSNFIPYSDEYRAGSNSRFGLGTISPDSPLHISYTDNAESGNNYQLKITPTYNQISSIASNTDLFINRNEIFVGSGTQYLIDAQVGGISRFNVSNSGNGYFAGNVGIGTTSPTASLNIKAGTATAGTAPLKFTSGTLNTIPEAGAMEFDGTNLYFSPSAGDRRIIGYSEGIYGSGTIGYLPRFTAADGLGNSILYDSGSAISVAGNIMPEMTGATGSISTRNIGDEYNRFAHIWAEDVHIGANSLYVNGKKVISDVSSVMNFTTDIDQSMIVKSMGIGSLGLQSDQGTLFLNSNSLISANGKGGISLLVPADNPSMNLNLSNNSLNGNITLNGTGANSQILASALQKISLTSPSIEFNGAVTIGTWQGSSIGVAYGGTGLTAYGSANQLMGMNATGNALEYKTINGTTNQITVTNGANSLTLSLPQNIHATATPTFGGLTINGNQAITGNLGLNASSYINFGGANGDTGYGFRDNGGIMEFKNSGGSWATFGAGSGSSTFLGLTDTPGAYTVGSILFTSGSAVTQDNANLFWDDANNRLGIGIITPTEMLDVAGNIQAGGYFSLSNLATAPLAPSNHGILYNVASSSSDSNSKLLLHANGPDNSTTFLDSSSSAHVMTTAGDARMSNIQYKFGGSSAYFDGSGDYIQTADSPDWDFSGDFTIDFWGKHNAISAYSTFLEIGSWTNSLLIRQDGASSFCLHFNSVSYCNTYSPNLDWHHYAIVRSGGFIKIFVDGVQIGSDISNNLNFQPANVLRVGSSVHSVGQYLNGYVDEFRISKGIARWTSNFTPPTTEYDQDSSGYFAYRDSSGTVTPLVGNGAAWRFAGANIYNNFSNIGIGLTSPTALLNIKAGTATAGTAPLKFTAGTNLTTTEAGAIEFDGAHLYFTVTNGGTRYQLDQQAGGLANPMTTLGDIIYGGASGAPTRLAAAAGFLTSTGSAAPAWTSFATDSFAQYALLAGRAGGQTLIGGTAANNTLLLQANSASSGNTLTNIGMQFKVGDSGATNALTVLNNGNIGIGTTSPGSILDILDTSSSATRGISLTYNVGAAPAGAVMEFKKARGTVGSPTTVATGDYISAFNFRPYDGVNYLQTAGFGAKVNGTVTGASVPTEIFFYTSGGAADTDPYGNDHVRLLINKDGKVGIGTTSPGALLHAYGNFAGIAEQGKFENINASGRSQITVSSGTFPSNFFALMTHGTSFANNYYLNDATNDAGLGILLGQGSQMTKFAIGTYDATPLSFFTNNTERLYVTPSGDVGIGTTSPQAKLDVRSNSTGYYTIGAFQGAIDPGTGSTRLYVTNPQSTFVLQAYGSAAPGILANAAGIMATAGSRLLIGATGVTMPTQIYSYNNYVNPELTVANGSVGIGTTTPGNKLSIVTAIGSNDTLPALGVNGGKLGIFNGGGAYGLIGGVLETGNAYMQVQRVDAVATAYNLLLQPNGGNVGIGTTNPEKKLHIYGDIGTDFLFQVESPNANANFLLLADTAGQAQSFSFRNVSAGGDGWNIANNASGNLVITSRAASINTDRFTLLSSGNVGVGTVSPRNKLDVSGAIMTTGASVNTPVANGVVLSSETSYDQLQSYNSRALYVNPLGNNIILNRDSGRVGIGTTTPGTLNGTSFASIKLQAYNASASTYAAIDTGLSNGEAGFLLNRGAASANNRMWGIASQPVPDTTTSALGFSTYSDAGTPTALMTILRNGNVGIGTTNPVVKLNVVGAISTADGTNGYMTMNTDDSATRTGFLEWRLGSGTRLGFMGDSASNIALALENNANFIIGGGNVGIGTDTPGAKLDIGSAGTSLGTLRLAGDTSGYVQLQPAAAAGSWTMTLPAAVGGAGEQLTDVAGTGVTTWTSAGSLRILKDIDNMVTDPNIALNQLLETNIYNFHYKEGMGTGDSDTQYVGVMADESPWAMHYDGRVINPVNTLGYMVLGVKALNNKIEISDTSFEEYVSQTEQTITTLTLKTDSDATTLLQLQTSIDAQLTIVQKSINNLVITNDDFETRIATLEAASEGNGLLISQLATQMEEIRAQVAEVDFVEMNDKLNSLLSFLDASDGVVKIDVLEATITETGALVIKNSDDEAPTIGTAIICPAMIELGADNKCSLVQTDRDNDGLDDETGHAVNDGKRVMVKTAAVKGASKVFMTIKSKLTQEATLMVTDIVENNNFTVELVNPTQEEVTFDWWIVEAK